MKHSLLVTLLFLIATYALPASAQDQILWTDQETDKIYAVNASDLGSQVAVQSVMNPGGVAYYHANVEGPLFFATSTNIQRGDLAETKVSIVNAGTINRGVAIDYSSKKIYWSDEPNNAISRANLDGTEQEIAFIPGVLKPFDIEIDPINKKLYWAEVGSSNDIKRANLDDGSNVETVVGSLDRCEGIAIDYLRNRIYYNVSTHQIYSASLDDPSDATVIIGLSTSTDVDVDIATGTLYVASGNGLKILTKANPDGTGKVTINVPDKAFFVAYADKTGPLIESIGRHNPLTSVVDVKGTATFRVTFSEPVMRVDKADFEIDGSVIGGNISVIPVSLNKIYDVVVSDLSATGTLRLKIASTNDILDFGGNAFDGSILAEESYTVAVGPEIASFSPISASVGSTVTINGSNFNATASDNTVTFNGITATIETATTTSLTVKVPAGATDGPIAVSVEGITTTSAEDFIVCVLPAKPTISLDGDILTSSASANNQWSLNDVAIDNATDKSLTVVDPGEYTVKVSNGACSTTSDPITVTDEMLTPSITSFDPTTGTPGTSVVITGSLFGENTTVEFNGVAAEVTSRSTTSITAVVPKGAGSGPITVTYNSRSGESTDFNYVCIDPPKPIITHEGGLLTSNSETNNQWFRNGVEIPSATSQTHAVIGGGAYTVRVSDDGCFSESDPTMIVALEERVSSTVQVYPNPAQDAFSVTFKALEPPATIRIYTLTGVQQDIRVLTHNDGPTIDFNISHFPKGMYVVVVSTPGGRLIKKLRKL